MSRAAFAARMRARLASDLPQAEAKMARFENRSGATLRVMSTGSTEGRHLQSGMRQIRGQTTLVEPREDGRRNSKTCRDPCLSSPASAERVTEVCNTVNQG